MALLTCSAAILRPPAPGQDQDPPSWTQPLVALCEDLLVDRTPELRGEAALILANTGMPEHHARLLAMARDPSSEARIRGILAVGILGEPGAEALLGGVLADGATRSGSDAEASAFALGLLPETHPAQAVDEYLMRFRRSSYRRQKDALASLLVGMAQEARHSRTTALRDLFHDEANKDEDLRALLIGALMLVPRGFDAEEVQELLQSPSEEELHATLRALVRTERPLALEELEQVARLAARDRSPRVRAAALDCLTLHRHLPALDLAAGALDSEDPAEVASAVRAVAKLGGGAVVARLETRALGEETEVIQAAMLAAFRGHHSEEFLKGCAALAVDPARPVSVRARAAALAVEHGNGTLGAGVRSLFLDARDPELLIVLATAIVKVAPDTPLVDAFYPPTAPEDLARLADRLRALAAAGHAEAYALLSAALADQELDPVTKADLLRAWRLGNWPMLDPWEIAMLPEAVAGLVR